MKRRAGPRPPIAIGHVMLKVRDVARSAKFYGALGLRPVYASAAMAILELRGGTHLLLFARKGAPKGVHAAPFDLMVPRVEMLRARLVKAGVKVTRSASDRISGHRWFELRDPDGNRVNVYSDHTEGRPV